MNQHFKQAFDINVLKIGQITNSGVFQIGSGAAKAQRVTPVGYTTVGTALVPLGAPLEFAVPLQAPVRK
ncbi:spore germination protein GerPB [Neobacillus dielmonensis]|uniref:spore germination protein GerPB n=1 Tax=Neobacillus dielmonensis TaxID=1347369 RepID=UPI0005A5E5AF|nr:spore germination protein GerPB [Neobacillus dielmonensis]